MRVPIAFLEPYSREAFLTACSLWAAKVFYTYPSNFQTYPASFRLVEKMEGDELAWAAIALTAGMLTLLGLAFAAVPRLYTASFLMRCVGLMLTGAFWMIMGASAVWGNPDSLFGFPGFIMGISALWTLIRVPNIPIV